MSLRLVGRPSTQVDLLLVRGAERVVRSDSTLWVVPAAGSRDALERGLALAGLGAYEEDAPVPRPDLVPSLGADLAPASEPSIEILTLRRIPLSDSTRRTLGRRSLRRLWPAYRTRRANECRALLRELDELAWWERRAWLAAGSLRAPSVRGSFRPILFDRAALGSPRPGGLLRARDGAITRWAFG